MPRLLPLLLAAVLSMMLAPAAPAHDHGEGATWSPLTGGPRLGHPAAEVLGHAPVAGPEVPGKRDLILDFPFMSDEERAIQRRLRRGGRSGGVVAHRAGRLVDAPGSPRAEYLTTGFTAAEPTLGVDASGNLFYVGMVLDPVGMLQSAPLRSRDGGRTWEPMDILVPGTEWENKTQDPFLYVDKDTGRVFNADFIMAGTVASWSDDQGKTWAQTSINQHVDHQNLFTGPAPAGGPQPSGYPNVVYYCAIDGGALAAFGTMTGCSRSLDGGATFLRTGGIPFQDDPSLEGGNLGIPGHCGGGTGHGAVGPDGTVYLPRGYCGQPYVAISRDMGNSWERVQVARNGFSTGAQTEEHEANVAVDRDGNVYYTYVAADRLPYLAISRDGGRSWGPPVMVAPPGVNEAWDVFVDAGDPGRVALSYIGTTNSPGPPYCVTTTALSCETADGQPPKPASAYADTTWNGYMAVSVNALQPKPTFVTGTVNDPADPLVRGVCGPTRCQQQFDFLDLVVGPDGTPWAAFVDGCPADPQEACPALGVGIVGHLTGAPPLVGPLPPATRTRGATGCRPRTARLRVPRGLRRVRVTVAGRRVRAQLRRGRLLVRIPAVAPGRAVVRVSARRADGRRFTLNRTLRACTHP